MDLLAGLNDPQQEAVTAKPGPILVLAGPGSGKTRVLTNRIVYLIQELGVPAWRILAVTFTNKAAREMRHRIAGILGDQPRGLTMGTFHATCAGILRREVAALDYYNQDFVIFDTDDQRQLMKQALADLDIDDKKYQPARMLNYISSAKNEGITPELYTADTHVAEVARRCYVRYQTLLQENNAMDFDDLLLNTVSLFEKNPDVLANYQKKYEHVLVDEFQDTNMIQYNLLKYIAAGHQQIFAVGDSDQSIYKWRGADVRNIKRFREHYPTAQMILLEQNYRSTQIILDAAKAVIRHNHDRVDKELFTERQDGMKIVSKDAYDEREEASMIVDLIAGMTLKGYDPADCAVMYRTNSQSRALEEAFLQRGLPYKLVGATRFYNRREIKDLIAYLRLVHNPSDMISFNRVINVPTRGIGKTSQDRLKEWAQQNGWSPTQALLELATNPEVQHPFRARAANALIAFGELLAQWYLQKDSISVGDLLDGIVRAVGYKEYIDDGTQEGEDRWANVMELRGVAAVDRSRSLAHFLEHVALVSEVDNLEEETNAPTLLTLHAAKGLEFPIVFISGLEDGILPHSRSFDDVDNMAEERRLFYVGITRAKDRLYLFRAFRRTSWGQMEVSNPSRFLDDLPAELVEGHLPQQKPKTKAWDWSSSVGRSSSSDSYGSYGSQTTYDSVRSTRKRPSSRPSTAHPVSTPKKQPKPKPIPKRKSPLVKKNADNKYKAGQKVSHAKFGKGIVVESRIERGDERVTVAFEDAGIKTLVASLAKLTIKE